MVSGGLTLPWAKYKVISAMLFYNLWSWNNLTKLNVSPLPQPWPVFVAQVLHMSILGLAGLKLIFFTVARMRLCFRCDQNNADNIGMF